ncbi:MAG: site-2 protease family protein [Candidatus Omnitrophica bacterium]|nr:site-2 protease family protein [Candidatus Omnitrophota bacterium]MCM8806617.1 site-2 protease family protein [Candidatus Omnitrophota bacterium]
MGTIDKIIFFIFLFFSVIIHEIAHGYIALKNGDPTAKYMGRLTLNPLPHIDPFGTFLLPIILIFFRSPILIGIAKPVPINPYYFKNYKIGMITVGFSGPLSNILLGITFALFYKFFRIEYFEIGSFINFILAFFNLIPIPPLDGSRIFAVLLPYNLRYKYEMLERYGVFIIIFLALMGFLNFLSPLSYSMVKFFTNL